jgi:SAM-dependent methyltransferase
MNIPAWYLPLLACPHCCRALTLSEQNWLCSCGFRAENSQPLDLRPTLQLERRLEVVLGTSAPDVLKQCLIEKPALTYSGPRATRDSSELFSAVSTHVRPGQCLLDLGCGPRDQAAPADHLGIRYVGVDYSSNAADALADAHTLPFLPASFDYVLSYAVLEHLYNPFLAMREIARVLKPGGLFVGTVSQGEPFHDSYFHHTAWGLLRLCEESGLAPLRLWRSYDTLKALATMGRYPKAGRWLINLLDMLLERAPVLSPRKHFRWSERERKVDALYRAASICFVLRKPA